MADGAREVPGIPPLLGFTVGVAAEIRRAELAGLLAGWGARVVRAPPDDARGLRRMAQAAVGGQLDAVTFTSPSAVVGLLAAADELGRITELEAALRGRVLAACLGPVSAAPLERRDVPVVVPGTFRLVSLVRALCLELPARRGRAVRAGGHELHLQGTVALVDGRSVRLAPKTAAVLAALLEQPGRVLSRAELLARTGGQPGGDEHAVEMTVGRLRLALGSAGVLVQTVVKRGYRIAVP